MSVRAVVAGVVVAVAVASEARVAWAQAPCPAAAESEAMEARGMALNQASRHAEALAEFDAAFQRCGGARAQVRGAITLMALGRWVEADRRMREALARDGDAWVRANRASVEQQRAVVARHVGRVVVEASAEGDGAGGVRGEVTVNGAAAGALPMREGVVVEAGEVAVAVTAAGYERAERRERVDAGAEARVRMTLRPVRAQAGAAGVAAAGVQVRQEAGPQASAGRRVMDAGAAGGEARGGGSTTVRRVLAWTSVGLAVVGAGVGAWATAERLGERQRYDDACPNLMFAASRESECNRLFADWERNDSAAPQVAGFVAAGVFAVAATVLFATMPGEAPARRAVACGGGPGTIGVGCEARF